MKFEDLTADQISNLRGPQGKSGRDGKDFNISEHKEDIFNLISLAVDDVKETLKLCFDDLSAEDIEKLRGPRGRDGREGKGFNFEEHRAFFEGLKPKFSDFTAEEVEQLKLHFDELTETEKDSLKLRFSDLTDEDRLSLRGERGPRGQRGSQGNDGEKGLKGDRGERGIRGQVGPAGISGRTVVGPKGEDGRDGEDAPYITDIKVDQTRDEVEFIFEFSNGNEIRTDAVKLPRPNTYTVVGGSSGGGGKGGGNSWGNLDGGHPDSIYGGTFPIDGGGI